jgi:hypothetical protein
VHRSAETLGEALVYLSAGQRRERSEVDASTGLDVRDRESAERMADDDRIRLSPDGRA